MTELTLEQQFNIQAFATKVRRMDIDTAQLELIELYKRMLIQENQYKAVIRKNWGFDNANTINH